MPAKKPKRMSFFLTQDPIRSLTKFVTRRNIETWVDARPGDRLLPIEKGQGLKAGESQKLLLPARWQIELVSCDERLIGDIDRADCILEGFPDMTPNDFVDMYAANSAKQVKTVRRFLFRYVRLSESGCVDHIVNPPVVKNDDELHSFLALRYKQWERKQL